MYSYCFNTFFVFIVYLQFAKGGILYPQDSETRDLRTLDGIWNFRVAPRNDPDVGFREQWFAQSLDQTGTVIHMPVPSSYNDVTQSKQLRDHVGWVWYDRRFWIPRSWLSTNQRIFLRFGSVNYHAEVWVNGIKVGGHSGGHLPFLIELNSSTITTNQQNRITVAVNNTLTEDTVPQGSTVFQIGSRYPPNYFTLNYPFDFFNYAGIHRSIHLYTTSQIFIDDITIKTHVNDDNGMQTGIVYYSVQPNSNVEGLFYSVELIDKSGQIVSNSSNNDGILTIENANLWWPYTMVPNDNDAGYLYTLLVREISLQNSNAELIDKYRLKVGIRSVEWSEDSFLINGRPFYFRGFGRHEDNNIRGRGTDNVMLVKDHNLIKWSGANSYRTSHYPYTEEALDICDELGIVVIDEVGAVSLDGFSQALLQTHKNQMEKLIQRDKNRPSVVIWAVANEPQSYKSDAGPYFRKIFDFTKQLDETRPTTAVIIMTSNYEIDLVAEYSDIISLNRYYAWYNDTGHTETIEASIELEVHDWLSKYKRPVMMTEYGADTIAGLHMSPEFVFTEEYQLEYIQEHFKAFDKLRKNTTAFIGEMIWSFADFMTTQGIHRVGGNKKGVFTRERQPKASGHLLRSRYYHLANHYDNYTVPSDMTRKYVFDVACK